MATVAALDSNLECHPTLSPDRGMPQWYAVYTWANHEKRVAGQLTERAVEHFLPLYESVRRWKDRRVRLQLPLFPGYVFVFLALRHRLQVLELPSVVHLVGFNGHPTALPESQIEDLRNGLAQPLRALPHPYVRIGRRVRIKGGPLQGMEGTLAGRKNNFRVVVSIELIRRSIAVDVDVADLEFIAH
jgi:transcription antitermination factor NusG